MCAACVLGKGSYPRVWKKETFRDEMESKAQITNTHQTSEVQVQICTSDSCGEGKNTKHCLGHSTQPWVGGTRVQILQLFFLSETVLIILRLGSGEVTLGSQFLFLHVKEIKMIWSVLLEITGQRSLIRKKNWDSANLQNESAVRYKVQSSFWKPVSSYAQ